MRKLTILLLFSLTSSFTLAETKHLSRNDFKDIKLTDKNSSCLKLLGETECNHLKNLGTLENRKRINRLIAKNLRSCNQSRFIIPTAIAVKSNFSVAVNAEYTILGKQNGECVYTFWTSSYKTNEQQQCRANELLIKTIEGDKSSRPDRRERRKNAKAQCEKVPRKPTHHQWFWDFHKKYHQQKLYCPGGIGNVSQVLSNQSIQLTRYQRVLSKSEGFEQFSLLDSARHSSAKIGRGSSGRSSSTHKKWIFNPKACSPMLSSRELGESRYFKQVAGRPLRCGDKLAELNGVYKNEYAQVTVKMNIRNRKVSRWAVIPLKNCEDLDGKQISVNSLKNPDFSKADCQQLPQKTCQQLRTLGPTKYMEQSTAKLWESLKTCSPGEFYQLSIYHGQKLNLNHSLFIRGIKDKKCHFQKLKHASDTRKDCYFDVANFNQKIKQEKRMMTQPPSLLFQKSCKDSRTNDPVPSAGPTIKLPKIRSDLASKAEKLYRKLVAKQDKSFVVKACLSPKKNPYKHRIVLSDDTYLFHRVKMPIELKNCIFKYDPNFFNAYESNLFKICNEQLKGNTISYKLHNEDLARKEVYEAFTARQNYELNKDKVPASELEEPTPEAIGVDFHLNGKSMDSVILQDVNGIENCGM